MLKLDTIKAFDCINWEFLYHLLERIGFKLYFLQVLKSINVTSSTTISVNGKLTSSFRLAQSLRQGCPLSPLLYLIAANALNTLLTQEIDRGDIRGVYIAETGEQYSHGQFSDDTNMVIEASRGYIDATFEIFHTMGKASGLFVKTSRVKAVLVPSQLLPPKFSDVDWVWEDDSNCSKLLRMFVGTKIAPCLLTRPLLTFWRIV